MGKRFSTPKKEGERFQPPLNEKDKISSSSSQLVLNGKLDSAQNANENVPGESRGHDVLDFAVPEIPELEPPKEMFDASETTSVYSDNLTSSRETFDAPEAISIDSNEGCLEQIGIREEGKPLKGRLVRLLPQTNPNVYPEGAEVVTLLPGKRPQLSNDDIQFIVPEIPATYEEETVVTTFTGNSDNERFIELAPVYKIFPYNMEWDVTEPLVKM